MDTQKTIKTLFEFTTAGHDAVKNELNSLLTAQRELTSEIKSQKKEMGLTEEELNKLIDSYLDYNKTLNSSSTRAEREEYVKTKRAIVEVQAAIAKLEAATRKTAKAREDNTRKIKEAKELEENYRQVIIELSKGIDNAEVSTKALTKAQKYLKEQLDKTNIGSEKYKALSREMAQVKQATDETSASYKQMIKGMDIAEGSLADLKMRLEALRKVQEKMTIGTPEWEEQAKKIKELSDELKAAEAKMGTFSRNVGNYKSAFDGLGWSMAQLTREAPAFAHSVTTGFMAISNNIPMLLDEIRKLRAGNAALNAEGQKTPSILQSVVKSFFSWNTVISLGITLLTVYGKDIVNWIGNLFNAAEALDSVTYAQQGLDATLKEAKVASQSEITRLQVLYEAATKAGLSSEARAEAMRRIQDAYPAYFANMDQETLMSEEGVKQYEALTKAIENKHIAQEAEKKIVEEENKLNKLKAAGVDRVIEAEERLAKNKEKQKQISEEINKLKLKRNSISALTEKEKYDAADKEVKEAFKQQHKLIAEDRNNKGQLKQANKAFQENNKEFYESIKDDLEKYGGNLSEYIQGIGANIEGLKPKVLLQFEPDPESEAKADEEAKKVAERAAQKAQTAADKARQEQERANSDYIRAKQEQMKATEAVAKAEQDLADKQLNLSGTVTAEEIKNAENILAANRKVLASSETALERASEKKLTLSQVEKDQLELDEYVHQQAMLQIQEDTNEKTAEEYLKAQADVRDAENELLEARKSGDAEQITLYERMLVRKQEILSKFNAEEIKLTEDQQIEQGLAIREIQQKQINDYISMQSQMLALTEKQTKAMTEVEKKAVQDQIEALRQKLQLQAEAMQGSGVDGDTQRKIDEYTALQQRLQELNQEYANAASDTVKRGVKTQIESVQQQVIATVAALRTLGIESKDIGVNIDRLVDKTHKYLSDKLQDSLKIIQQFSGKAQNNFFKLSTSISTLLAKAYDKDKELEDLTEGTKEYTDKLKELKTEQAALAAAVAINSLNTATDLINDGIEREKKAIDQMYEYQSDRAEAAYDRDSAALKRSLDKKKISEVRYRLEQMKLDDKKAKEDKKREKEKAEALYELEVKQFRVQQAQDAASVAIATALAIATTLGQGGFFATPLLPIVTALGAAQIAAIYAQSPPEKPRFEKGGGVRFEQIEGPSHAHGGVPIRFGNKVVAEAEGDEGALIISKKAMKNSYMRNLLHMVESMNAEISGGQTNPGVFEEGGYLSYDDDFLNPEIEAMARNTKHLHGRVYKVYGQKQRREKSENREGMIQRLATPLADKKWDEYISQLDAAFSKKEEDITSTFSAGIQGNETLRNMGITDQEAYTNILEEKQEMLDALDAEIRSYEDLAKAKEEALKVSLDYDRQMADFEQQRADASNELQTSTLEFNKRMLDELLKSGEITQQEYDSMLDQVSNNYGVKTNEIIELKKKEVEKIKALIEEERAAEIKAANETSDYRKSALAQIRSDWDQEYSDITQQIIDDVEGASDAVSKLSGMDLERYNQILDIQQRIKKLNEDYEKNDAILNDGVIQSREEQARLVAEQKRIKEELARKEEEAEVAKAAFEQEREKNRDDARKQYETDNFSSLLEQIKQLGTELQTEGNKWTLDKQLAADLDEELQSINSTYDDQIAKQDAIIDGLKAEQEQMQLLYDKKIAYIKKEEDALKSTYEAQKAAIDKWLDSATQEMRKKARDLNSILQALQAAGYEVGLSEYEKAMKELGEQVSDYEAVRNSGPKYATGGAIELGSGLFQVSGPSHTQGGVPVSIGSTQIAEVEGIEKMFAVNKLAAFDPEMMAALSKASEVNARYTGVPLMPEPKQSFSLDYDMLASKIGEQINMRPSKAFLTHKDIRSAYDITERHRKASFMK